MPGEKSPKPITCLEYVTSNLQKIYGLNYKELEMHGCIIDTFATDALVLKQQATSINSAEQISFAFHQSYAKISYDKWRNFETKIKFEKHYPVV